MQSPAVAARKAASQHHGFPGDERKQRHSSDENSDDPRVRLRYIGLGRLKFVVVVACNSENVLEVRMGVKMIRCVMCMHLHSSSF